MQFEVSVDWEMAEPRANAGSGVPAISIFCVCALGPSHPPIRQPQFSQIDLLKGGKGSSRSSASFPGIFTIFPHVQSMHNIYFHLLPERFVLACVRN